MNSLKNEYRQNDNARKRITPVGDDIDRLRDRRVEQEEWELRYIVRDAESWLMFIEDERLYQTVIEFSSLDKEILFLMFFRDLPQRDVAMLLGVTQPAITYRWKRMQKIFLEKLQ